jgi:glycosyltransferase involved in cell wall biosynthesis
MNKSAGQLVSYELQKMPKQSMCVCFLSAKHPPLDKRVFDKEATSLAQHGFEVVHLAPHTGAAEWVQRQVRLVTYAPPRRTFDRLLQLPRLYRLAARVNADCYHCNEVDSWLVGVLLKLMRGKKVVFDVHEHYPSMFAESLSSAWLQPWADWMMRLGFRLLTLFTDRLVFAKKFISEDFAGSEPKHVLVENFVPLAYKDVQQQDGSRLQKGDAKGGVRAIYLGSMERQRGCLELLDAVARARSQDLCIEIVGTFVDDSRADFERRVVELGLAERVSIEDWLPFDQAYQKVLGADIGLILFLPGQKNHNLALPHKMFDYMLAGLPIIAPNFAQEVVQIIKEADCGILIDPLNPDEIAQALDRLAIDPKERQRLGRNGRYAVLEKYNWEAEFQKLLEMYTTLQEEVR